jgi:hypothetical protein
VGVCLSGGRSEGVESLVRIRAIIKTGSSRPRLSLPSDHSRSMRREVILAKQENEKKVRKEKTILDMGSGSRAR